MRPAALVSAGLLVLLLLAAAAAHAGDGPEAGHLRWRRTYGAALFEARVRNLPVLVTRQKDG